MRERRETIVHNIKVGGYRDRRTLDIQHHFENADPVTIAIEVIEPLLPRKVFWHDPTKDGEIAKARSDQNTFNRNRRSEAVRLASELVAIANVPDMPKEMAQLNQGEGLLT